MNINNKSYCVLNENSGIEEKPYEKCLMLGAKTLSDAQLLAVILRTGTNGVNATELAGKIIGMASKNCEESLLGITHLSVPELMSIKGVGQVKAIQIQCICELSRRMAKQRAAEKLDFSSPSSIADYYMEDLRHLDKEQLVLVMLDSRCCFIRDCVISVGTVNASLVNSREVFAEALKYNAVSIVLLHNHPSGDSTPSRNDILVTAKIKDAGEIVGINLIDHIIIGDNMYTSLKEKEYF
ncbi:MAG: DNA repair protein RadC [Lachnospira sp.]|nr:DNA repair protein RadC [Lachnospira sp.]